MDGSMTAPITPEGLTYSQDGEPGILRRRHGKGFRYLRQDGLPLSSAERTRIRRLGIPPAYDQVWICANPSGHLQATGLDARGRRQYRYHPDWAAWRSDRKFGQLPAFGAALPTLRRRLERDLQNDTGDMTFCLAALVTLLDRTWLRIGNPVYAAQNRSFGASTLLARHLTLADGHVTLRFRAKGGKPVRYALKDRKLHRILQEIHDLPGRNLFTWLDDSGKPQPVASQHVNAYLAEITGLPETSAKTFRTWGGSLAAFDVARKTAGTLTLRAMADAAAERLANTPAICRSSYIHPAILGLADLPDEARQRRLADCTPLDTPGLFEPERHMLAFLQSA